MFRGARCVWLGVLLLALTRTSFGEEIWAFRFNSVSYGIGVSWHDDLVFHNTTAQDASVRLTGVSNGQIRPDETNEISVPAGRTVSMAVRTGLWWPDSYPGFWVVRVDVPEGVLVASRGGVNAECPSPCGAPPNPFPNLGAFTMPVFRALVPPGERQVLIGTDLGAQSSRFNVGLYNAGERETVSTVSVYQACDDALLESRTVAVPANTTLQVGGFGSAKTHCDPNGVFNTWLRHAVVVMDQPGISYVFNMADDLPFHPRIPLGAAVGF